MDTNPTLPSSSSSSPSYHLLLQASSFLFRTLEGGGDSRVSEMPEVPKLLYIVVDDGEETREKLAVNVSFRYTRSVLQSTLQLMGCKPRHAFKISRRVFEVLRHECSGGIMSAAGIDISGPDFSDGYSEKEDNCNADNNLDQGGVGEHLISEYTHKGKSIPFELYKRRTTVVVGRESFLDVVCDALSEYKYVGPNQRADLILACRDMLIFVYEWVSRK